MQSSDGDSEGPTFGKGTAPESALAGTELTNAVLQSKISNLALAFPIALQSHSLHYKRVLCPSGDEQFRNSLKPKTGGR